MSVRVFLKKTAQIQLVTIDFRRFCCLIFSIHVILWLVQTLESREITHLQFTGWPDYGVPHSAAAFLDFMFLVRQKQQQCLMDVSNSEKIGGDCGGSSPPIVIHCSAGIGRTGFVQFHAVAVVSSCLCALSYVGGDSHCLTLWRDSRRLSDFVNECMSVMWFVVCCWLHSQTDDLARLRQCRFARPDLTCQETN